MPEPHVTTLDDVTHQPLFPGIGDWFERRRHHARTRERDALAMVNETPPGHAVDVPVAGADWPYGRPLDYQKIIDKMRAYEIDHAQFRIYLTPDPPGTLIRIRCEATGRNLRFVSEICADARRDEETQRMKARAPPFEPYAAQLAGAWLGVSTPAGLIATAPPDPLAAALAAATAAVIIDSTTPVHDNSDFVPLDEVDYDYTTAVGRARLNRLQNTITDVDAAAFLAAGPRGWRIVAPSGTAFPDQTKLDLQNEADKIIDAIMIHPGPEFEAPSGHEAFDTYLGRLGLGILATMASIPETADDLTPALAFVAEHGTTAGLDAHVRAFLTMVGEKHPIDGMDARLALERLLGIPQDPCHATVALEAFTEGVANR